IGERAILLVMERFWLHRYAVLLGVCTLFLVVAGASVTSKEEGLSVPDWPLSYGQVMPQMTGGVFFEHGHRMVATFVGILTIGLAIWLKRADPRPGAIAVFTSRSWQQGPQLVNDYGAPSLRSLAILTPSLVLVQIALGAAFRHGAIGVMAHVIGAMV